ncbi:hypothetical protein GmHk_18G050622 [Glycine max]|nr:hypothetical protein GmHk_18G050622 [Glycine max]
MGEHNTTEKKGAKRQIRNRKGIEQNKIVHKHKGTNQPLRIRVFFSLRLAIKFDFVQLTPSMFGWRRLHGKGKGKGSCCRQCMYCNPPNLVETPHMRQGLHSVLDLCLKLNILH